MKGLFPGETTPLWEDSDSEELYEELSDEFSEGFSGRMMLISHPQKRSEHRIKIAVTTARVFFFIGFTSIYFDFIQSSFRLTERFSSTTRTKEKLSGGQVGKISVSVTVTSPGVIPTKNISAPLSFIPSSYSGTGIG